MKKDIEEVFLLNNQDSIVEFCKAYALKDQEFAKQLIKCLLPQKEEDNTKDRFAEIDKELAKCFQHPAKKGYYQRWGPDLEWDAIGEDLYRLIGKGQYMFELGLIHEAAYLALEVLREVGKVYYKDRGYEEHDLRGDDLCLDDAVCLLDIAVSSSAITREEKLKIATEIEKIGKMEAYDSYCLCEVYHLVEGIHKSLLPTEDYVEILKLKFEQASDYSKGVCATNLFHFYLEKNLTQRAEDWAKSHLEYSAIIYGYTHWLISQQRLTDALTIFDTGIGNNTMDNCCRSVWEISKLGVYESLGDKLHIIEQCRKLLISEYRFIQYYHKLKILIARNQWSNYLDELLSRKKFNGDATGEFPQIYYQEKQFNKLYELLNKADHNQLSALKTYATSLTKEQQTTLIVKIERTLQAFAKDQMGRSNYKELAGRLNVLKGCCDLGKIFCEKLVAEFRTAYCNRPAMLEELKNCDDCLVLK